MYSRNTGKDRGRGIVPPYNYGGTVYSNAGRANIGDRSEENTGTDRADPRYGIAPSAGGTTRDGMNKNGMNPCAAKPSARASAGAAGNSITAARCSGGCASQERAQSRSPEEQARYPASQAASPAVKGRGREPDRDRAERSRDYPPMRYPDAVGRGGRPTADEAPRPVRRDHGAPDIGALLGALPPSDDILLIFLLITLISAKSEGKGGDDLLIAIIAMLLLAGKS